MRRTAIAVIGALVLAVWAAQGHAADPTLKLASKEGVGQYLVDGAGKSLYWFTKDSVGTSVCRGPCAELWPVFSAAEVQVPAGLTAGDFASIDRPDGKKQTTFRGYPLYYYARDAAPGNTFGQGVNGVWFVIDPANFPPKAPATY